jgi:hypothetical protein
MRSICPAVLLLLVASLPASPQAVSSGELVENANERDGQVVTFTGEAIGEAMRRGSMAWIHLNDDAYMWRNIEEGTTLGGYNSGQAVWVAADLAERISFFGDFAHEGDVVEVTGVFHAACPEHGGDMDIHATGMRVVLVGHRVSDPVDPRHLVFALALAVAAALAFFLQRLVQRRLQ